MSTHPWEAKAPPAWGDTQEMLPWGAARATGSGHSGSKRALMFSSMNLAQGIKVTLMALSASVMKRWADRAGGPGMDRMSSSGGQRTNVFQEKWGSSTSFASLSPLGAGI